MCQIGGTAARGNERHAFKIDLHESATQARISRENRYDFQPRVPFIKRPRS